MTADTAVMAANRSPRDPNLELARAAARAVNRKAPGVSKGFVESDEYRAAQRDPELLGLALRATGYRERMRSENRR
jgi:hypothetical protein